MTTQKQPRAAEQSAQNPGAIRLLVVSPEPAGEWRGTLDQFMRLSCGATRGTKLRERICADLITKGEAKVYFSTVPTVITVDKSTGGAS